MGIVDRTPPTVRGNLGKYNKIIKVNSSTTFGSKLVRMDLPFILENVSNVVIRFRWWSDSILSYPDTLTKLV